MFAAQAFSAAFYCIGFGEGIAAVMGAGSPFVVACAAAAAGVLLIALAFLGADLATRFQFVIMGILALAIISFFVGGVARFEPALLASNWQPTGETRSFWPLFAIFFPAVTGFTQGVSMSGELRDPGRSLPLGTFLAVGLSTLVYVAVIIVLGGVLPGATLATQMDSMREVASHGWIIDAGVISATLSSALASLLGAPRILQALARDGVFRSLRFFARGHGDGQNLRRAVLLTGGIALVTIAAGNLNTIAALVSMFFLISYGLLNYATYIEATAASPSFRPRFRFFRARASGLGVLLCAGAMLAIDPFAGAIAVAILAAVYQYVRRTAVPANWRDSRRPYRLRQVREGLRAVAGQEEKPGDWQPQILVFTESVERRSRVLQFASWISGGTGIVTAVQVIEGETRSESVREACSAAEQALRAEIDELGLDAYALALTSPDLRSGLSSVVQSWGAGPIRSNLVLSNWLGDGSGEMNPSAELWYGRTLGQALRLRRSVVVLDADEEPWLQLKQLPNDQRRIDVWWFGDASSRLALLLAYLITRDVKWDEAKIRVLITAAPNKQDHATASLQRQLEETRIDALAQSVVASDVDAVVSHSRDAALVFPPLRLPGMRLEDPFGFGIDTLLEQLAVVALVAAAEDVQIADEEPAPAAPIPAGDESEALEVEI